MKFLPEFFSDTFDVFQDPFFTNSNTFMKTDIQEKNDQYELNMELPGYLKEDLHMELSNGYLHIKAQRQQTQEQKDAQGKLIRQERIAGSCSRSFYVGDRVREEEIKASYDNGELKILIPKHMEQQLERKKMISIE